MNIYVLSYCQNEYQRGRVRSFVENSGNIVNDEFGVRYCDILGYRKGSKKIVVHDNESDLLKSADEIWIVTHFFERNLFGRWGSLGGFEKFFRGSGKPRKYFKIVQTGKYVGTAKQVNKKELLEGRAN